MGLTKLINEPFNTHRPMVKPGISYILSGSAGAKPYHDLKGSLLQIANNSSGSYSVSKSNLPAELSDVLKSFDEGYHTKIREEPVQGYKTYFQGKGEHFCAGFILRPRAFRLLFPADRSAYEAAVKFWNESTDNRPLCLLPEF